jgi:hypothetical protein
MPVLPALPPLTTDTVVTALAARLSNAQFWTLTELQLYAVEACRTWNAVARWCRQRIAFDTASNPIPYLSQWYDLSQVAPSALGYNITDAQLTVQIEYLLLEPPTYPTWTGTLQFTTQDILTAIQARRDQFILETLQVLSIYLPGGPTPPASRFPISDSVLDVRRCAWRDTTSGVWSNLWRDNEFAVTAFMPSWAASAAIPQVYSVAVAPDFQVQVMPPPAANGTLHMVVASAGPAPNALAAPPGVSLGIPDDFVWVVKFGALADLLSKDGPARDPQRAAYAEQRWRQGLDIARAATTVMAGQIAGQPFIVDSVFALDAFSTGWLNAAPAQPSIIATAGLNVVAVDTPTPVTVPPTQYGLSFDCVVNCPLPTAVYVSTPLPVGRDAFDVIVDYAEHLAAFKMGGEEFAVTNGLWDRMLRLGSVYNERIRAVAEPAIMDRARLMESQVPSRVQSS